MATTQEIAADIKKTYGGSFINATQARKYLSMGKDKARTFFAAIPVYPTGKENKYHALDIARHMNELRKYKP